MARSQLLVQHCARCRIHVHFPLPLCPECGGALIYREVGGRGTIATFTLISKTTVPGFEDGPFAVGWVDLIEEDGLRLFGFIETRNMARLRIGMPVVASFRPAGEARLLLFRPDPRHAEPFEDRSALNKE